MKVRCSSCGIETDAADAIETHGLVFCIECVEAIVGCRYKPEDIYTHVEKAPGDPKRLDITFVFPNTDDEQPV